MSMNHGMSACAYARAFLKEDGEERAGLACSWVTEGGMLQLVRWTAQRADGTDDN